LKLSGTLVTKADLQKKILSDIKALKKFYPNAHCELDHESPFQLLIATILSAQCTDERVNKVTKVLFAEFPDADSLSKASLLDIEQIIKSTGFFKNKAQNLKLCSQKIMELYQGHIPQKMEELIELAGVGRKTANVVLGNAFGLASGVVVDTHVGRLARRLGWVKEDNPEKVEKKLMQLVPEKDWIQISHYLIFHGRRLCKARNPNCKECFLKKTCPSFKI
jgi:endonuclease-3